VSKNAVAEFWLHAPDNLKSMVKPGSFIDRILTTFSTDDDLKADDHYKYIHSMGVCAPAEWKIDHPAEIAGSPLTGLFAPTYSPVKGIVRLSVSVNDARYTPGQKRAWGLAIKLFPSPDPNQVVATKNLLFFDRYGLDGSDRPFVLLPPQGDHSVQFLNFINDTAAKSAPARLISSLFSFFDVIASYRPLNGFSGVDEDNRDISTPNVPTFLALRARPVSGSQELLDSVRGKGQLNGYDFRNELQSYASGGIVFDVFVSGASQEDIKTADTAALTTKALALHELLDDPRSSPAPIGTLTLGKPTVSTDCDLRLHFAHDPNPIPKSMVQ
jgi:hypothetical protein